MLTELIVFIKVDLKKNIKWFGLSKVDHTFSRNFKLGLSKILFAAFLNTCPN